jgi:hypothetical protein
MKRRKALLGALVAGLLVPASAVATEGNLYPYGSSIWAVGFGAGATVLPGPVWQVSVPASSDLPVGNRWEMNWGCPVGGSEVARVSFGALRTQAPSSLEVRVTGNRAPLWQLADASLPQSPAGGAAYAVDLPGGQCDVHLALAQVETRAQHARGYFIDNPRVLVRDVAPPSVALRALTPGWINAGGTLRVDWTTGDNFGDDGVGVQRVVAGGRVLWTGAPGAGNHGLDLGLDGVPDGVIGVRVEADGDGTAGGAAAGTIAVDRTGPAVSALAQAATATPGGVSFSWRAGDATSGVAGSQVELNSAADGSSSGSWETVARADGGGAHAAAVVAPAGIPDGVHAWRVRATDVAGNATLVEGPGRVVVDTAAPRLDLSSIPAGWVRSADLDLTASDNLQATLGLGATEIDVNTAADGGEGGQWLRRSTTPTPPGRRVVPLDLSGLEQGRHAVRVVVRNGGPLGATLAAERRAVLKVDLQPPVISRAGFSPAGDRPMTVSWAAEDGHAGVATATVQWRDGGSWRTIGTDAASDGAGRMVIDASTVPNGERVMRLLIADAAGNVAARTGRATITGGGVGSTAGDPIARLRSARVVLRAPGARRTVRGGRALLVRRLTGGRATTIAGRLIDARGHGIVGSDIQVRGHRGRVIGRGLTRRGGAFAIRVRPIAGGVARLTVPVGRSAVVLRTTADLRLEVRPHLGLGASTTSAFAGEQVVFSGRIQPAPAALGLGGRKGVTLEWLDPVRRSWRPVVNAHIRADGTFAIPWTFGLRGLTIPMRATVAAETGWPLLPVRSPVVRVAVR